MRCRLENVTVHFNEFVETQLLEGRFRNASAVVRPGLRLLEEQAQEREAKLSTLRSLAAKAFGQLDQGQGIELNDARSRRSWFRKIGKRAEGKRARTK